MPRQGQLQRHSNCSMQCTVSCRTDPPASVHTVVTARCTLQTQQQRMQQHCVQGQTVWRLMSA
jgi:hypothetical protein